MEAPSSKVFKLCENTYKQYDLPLQWDKKLDIGDLTKLRIFVNEKDSFQAKNLNIFTNYVLTFYGAELVDKWRFGCNMTFYQNQLNFAVWCASAGCGVSFNDHLKAKENLLSSVYKFHIYYQTRKILEEMSCPIPGESIFNETDNRIDKIKFQKLCNEFDVKDIDFRFKGGDNGGLGTMYNYHASSGYAPVQRFGNYHIAYDPSKYQFVKNSTFNITKIDYVYQEAALEGWKQFILENAWGFTKAGIVRLDDSIRTFVYCLLGAQAQTRSNIITSPETQQVFVDLLEKNIKSMFSIAESISQYQDAISKVHVKIDYVVGFGLYMIPSNLILNVSSVVGYNNNIITADETLGLKIGLNETINRKQRPFIKEAAGHSNVYEGADSKEPFTTTRSGSMVSYVYLSLGVSLLVFGVCYVFLRK